MADDKIELVDVTGGYNISAMNNNFDKIMDALNNKVLWRDNPVNTDNAIKQDLDMDGNQLYNVRMPVLDHEVVRLVDLKNLTSGGYYDQTLHVNDGPLNALPNAAERAGKLVSFDENGQPVVAFPSEDSATQLRLDLAASDGSELVGFIQEGAGAVVRVAQDKMRERVTPYDFGAVGDGVADDTLAFINCLVAHPNTTIRVPQGRYRIANNLVVLPATVLEMEQGAILVGVPGATITMQGQFNAGRHQIMDFSGGGVLAGLKEGLVEWFGAKADDVTNCTPAVQQMVNFGVQVIRYGQGNYFHASTVNLLPNSTTNFFGAGFRATNLKHGTGSTVSALFRFASTGGSTGCVTTFDSLTFWWVGTPNLAGSVGIYYVGAGDGNDSNWMRVRNCNFFWHDTAILTKWCGQCYYEGNFYQANNVSHRMERGSAFFYFYGEMSFDNLHYIYAIDPLADAYSNGFCMESCHGFGTSGETVYIEGWQSIYIAKCGFDTGMAGEASIWFKNCQDIGVEQCYISSDVGLPRKGVISQGCRSVWICNNTIVNNSIGIDVYAPVANLAAQVVVDGNKFGGDGLNYIILRENVEGCKIVNNHFERVMSRTGSNFEVYGIATCNNNICSHNTFFGPTYTINLGPQSLTDRNLFSVKS